MDSGLCSSVPHFQNSQFYRYLRCISLPAPSVRSSEIIGYPLSLSFSSCYITLTSVAVRLVLFGRVLGGLRDAFIRHSLARGA
eukprot:15072836-Heterocapsa_arctica.AAC.1